MKERNRDFDGKENVTYRSLGPPRIMRWGWTEKSVEDMRSDRGYDSDGKSRGENGALIL
jgi:hypothetical protein